MSKVQKAFPGLCLGSTLDYSPMGKNVYIYMGKVYSSAIGKVVYMDNSVEVLTK